MLLARTIKPCIVLALSCGGVAAGHGYLRRGDQKHREMLLDDLPVVTDDEKWAAIDLGVEWLANQQQAGGSWDYIGTTALALVKLVEYAREQLPPKDPFDPEYTYSAEVEDGFDWLFFQARPYGHPNCFAQTLDPPNTEMVSFGTGSHSTYYTGIAMMAIAATAKPDKVVNTGPFQGKTFKDILTANKDFMVCIQNQDGGWRYGPGSQPSDNSNTGFAVLGLAYAENPPWNIPIAQAVKIGGATKSWTLTTNGLSSYIDYIQNDATGGSGYVTPDWGVNILKTGNLIFEAAFVGDGHNTQRVMDAIAYIEDNWEIEDAGMGWGIGWIGHTHAMYCMMKGLQFMGVETILGGKDWFQDVVNYLVPEQERLVPALNGSWPSSLEIWGGQMLATEFALLTLEKVAPVDSTPPFITCPPIIVLECMDDTTILPDCTAEDPEEGPVPCTCEDTIDRTTPGTHARNCTAQDSVPNVAQKECMVEVEDSTPPVITFDPPGDMTVECADDYAAPAVTAFDTCSEPVTLGLHPDSATVVTTEPGTYPIIYVATDNIGNVATASINVIVEDTTAPTLRISDYKPFLWSPNHKMVDVGTLWVEDACPSGVSHIMGTPSVTSNEHDESGADTIFRGRGQNKKGPDWEFDCNGDNSMCGLKLRAERAGYGNGRVYTISASIADGSGNTGEGSFSVTVPHNPS